MGYYLDTAATTKPNANIINEIMPYLTELWHNPSALYGDAVKVRNKIEEVRKDVAKLIGASKPNEIVFESGAAEANNHVIRGWDDIYYNEDSVIIASPIEHKSIMMALKNPVLQSKVYYCDVDEQGFVDMESLRSLLEQNKGKKILVTIGAANSEIGTVQDIRDLAYITHEYGGIFHTDATQHIPYLPMNVEALGIDLLSASAQKCGALKGTGFLYIRNGVELGSLVFGTQEGMRRGGTENVVGIVALGEAIKHIDFEQIKTMSDIRDKIIGELERIGCKLNGARTMRLPNNINVCLPHGIGSEEMVYMMDVSYYDIASGSACNSSSVDGSQVLIACGLEDRAKSSIRISFDRYTITLEDINDFIDELSKAIKILKSE